MKKITNTQKKWLLSVHILFAAILFGAMVGFLVLSITAASTKSEDVLKACYTGMHILSKTTVKASTIGSLATGILLSVLTHWGLLKYYWILVKEALTVIAIGLGVVGMYEWSLKAVNLLSAEDLHVLQNPSFIVNGQQMMMGIILQIISLAAMVIISVFKPWGKRSIKPA